MNDQPAPPVSVSIERTLDSPVEVVWKAWTDPDHFRAWYGPTSARIPVADLDARVGGRRLVCMEMETPSGPMRMWFVGEHLEFTENRRLVYSESMSDEEGNVRSPADAGMPEGAPTTTEVVVEFEDLGGRTRLVMTHLGVPAGSPGETGWTMALDKLASHLGAGPGAPAV